MRWSPTFHDDTLHPWLDAGRALARSLRSAATGLVGLPIDSAGTRTRDDRRDRARMFRDADVIGHPANLLSLPGVGGTVPMVCPTAVRPLQPYFSSYLDALAWRSMLPVEWFYPASCVPGMREIGAWPANSWGAVYPRDGNVTQQHPVKAAAVLAQRAGDITTRTGQPHVYLPLPTGGRRMVGNSMVWLPPPLMERDASTGKWQMLAPLAQRSCEVFGANDSVLPVSWGDGRTSGSGGYAFNLWRPYSCCSRAGQCVSRRRDVLRDRCDEANDDEAGLRRRRLHDGRRRVGPGGGAGRQVHPLLQDRRRRAGLASRQPRCDAAAHRPGRSRRG